MKGSVGRDRGTGTRPARDQPYNPSMELDSIFKAYDVRGLYPAEINETVARAVGSAFAVFADVDRIAVGRDCRVSSPSIAASLIEGLTSAGGDGADIGEGTSEARYFASGSLGLRGVIVGASHGARV